MHMECQFYSFNFFTCSSFKTLRSFFCFSFWVRECSQKRERKSEQISIKTWYRSIYFVSSIMEAWRWELINALPMKSTSQQETDCFGRGWCGVFSQVELAVIFLWTWSGCGILRPDIEAWMCTVENLGPTEVGGRISLGFDKGKTGNGIDAVVGAVLWSALLDLLHVSIYHIQISVNFPNILTERKRKLCSAFNYGQ